MAFTIYKPGQGYYTRMMSGIGAGILVVAGVAWLVKQLSVVKSDYVYYYQVITAAVIILGAFVVLWYLLNKPRIVDFMIATESEMRKVNWPSRREIIKSTWVVICGTVLMAVLLLVVDVAFARLFTWIGVLEGVAS